MRKYLILYLLVVLHFLPSLTICRAVSRPGNHFVVLIDDSRDMRGLRHQEQILDLESCAEPCREGEGALIIPFLELADELRLSPKDPVPRTAGVFEFAVTFRFATGDIYDHLWPETQRQRIELEPVEPTVVPGIFSTDVLDNRTLAGLWRPEDAESPAGGLTQRVAVDSVRLPLRPPVSGETVVVRSSRRIARRRLNNPAGRVSIHSSKLCGTGRCRLGPPSLRRVDARPSIEEAVWDASVVERKLLKGATDE